jgi:REP element-mobilizing transposase RayT
MSDRFKDRYRITSARKTNWDYSSEGMYHVTLCTGGRELYFGNVIEDKMVFSDIGYIANNYWLEIPEHFAFIQLDKFQVMPNHIHGILKIDHHLKNSKSPHLTSNKAKRVFVETLHATALRAPKRADCPDCSETCLWRGNKQPCSTFPDSHTKMLTKKCYLR